MRKHHPENETSRWPANPKNHHKLSVNRVKLTGRAFQDGDQRHCAEDYDEIAGLDVYTARNGQVTVRRSREGTAEPTGAPSSLITKMAYLLRSVNSSEPASFPMSALSDAGLVAEQHVWTEAETHA
ncbi:MAG: hypothetical protein KJ904_05845 [Alphaproteobacteria bacterium]|nr:hypothetical protein [Alphaproteobacteria bacterium]MBU0795806.1 hypothetical protein [Alphaproteobacteria bacterium]MBU0886668.1 hypothetical protein [Alphaproteobacteria bacterium]MBU1814523.1 hypothetical protein [Alphaproteobacteria bacterium]MBU2090529.1 hypothetical protein [Alphaproteobacteria bacterium]